MFYIIKYGINRIFLIKNYWRTFGGHIGWKTYCRHCCKIFAKNMFCVSARHAKLLNRLTIQGFTLFYIYCKINIFWKSSVLNITCWSYEHLIMFKRLYWIRRYSYISIPLGFNLYYINCMTFFFYVEIFQILKCLIFLNIWDIWNIWGFFLPRFFFSFRRNI